MILTTKLPDLVHGGEAAPGGRAHDDGVPGHVEDDHPRVVHGGADHSELGDAAAGHAGDNWPRLNGDLSVTRYELLQIKENSPTAIWTAFFVTGSLSTCLDASIRSRAQSQMDSTGLSPLKSTHIILHTFQNPILNQNTFLSAPDEIKFSNLASIL